VPIKWALMQPQLEQMQIAFWQQRDQLQNFLHLLVQHVGNGNHCNPEQKQANSGITKSMPCIPMMLMNNSIFSCFEDFTSKSKANLNPTSHGTLRENGGGCCKKAYQNNPPPVSQPGEGLI